MRRDAEDFVVTEISDLPPESEGKMTANIGNYHIDSAYGGYSLHRMASEGGGVTDVLKIGHVSKKELNNLIFAYKSAIYDHC